MEDESQGLDRVDQIILELLGENARRTYGDIGRHVGLSAPAVKRRVDRLEAAGISIGYTVRLNHARLGRPLEAFTELRFSGNARALAQATWRHVLFGITLGALEALINDRSADEPPPIPVSSNGHGSLDRAVTVEA